MTERRVDPFTGRAVLIAAARRRLGGRRGGGLPSPAGRCPFCPGHEADTEQTVARWPAEGPWRVRVVRNKFPLVSAADGLGDHEVVVETPAHDASLASLPHDHRVGLLRMIRDRVRALSARDGIAAVVPFRNRGLRSGSSQPHPHAQIIATSWVPSEVALRWERARSEPVHARELSRELAGPRLIEADDEMAAFCPYAPSRVFEVRLAPRSAEMGFESATEPQLASLGRMLGRACAVLTHTIGIEDFNLVFRTPPAGAEGPAASWHVDLLPRRGGDAGFELASRERVVVVPPEEAAERYRDAW